MNDAIEMTAPPESPLAHRPAPEPDLSRMAELGEEAGYFRPLGDSHWAFFSDEGTTLLVTFDSAERIAASADGLPAGQALAAARGWSHLCLVARGETWFRDPAVYRFFDQQVDDAFFEDFDHVVFYGAGLAGYAACAYSVTAPGSIVLALHPLATLDPAVAGWDRRHRRQRRLSFTDRYGYAPDMVEGAGEVFLLFDPQEQMDAMHAALFARPGVHSLACPRLGGALEPALMQMQALVPLLEAAAEGRLDVGTCRRILRLRRNYSPYLHRLYSELEGAGRLRLAAMLARNVAGRLKAPRFRRRAAELDEVLLQQGRPLPRERPRPAQADDLTGGEGDQG
jgi:hypothetical protein